MSSNLKKGISILYDMELNNYMMTRTIQKLNNKISNMGYPRKIEEPRKGFTWTSIPECTGWGMIIGGIVGVFVSLVSGCVVGDGFFDKIWQIIVSAFKFGLICLAVGLLIGLIVGIVKKSIEASEVNERFNMEWKEYKRKIADDNSRVAFEKQQIVFLKRQRDELVRKRDESRRILNQFYIKMNIDKSYRNLVPIGYMAQFMKLGISTKLEGADGLYYLVLRELKADQLQYTLEEISNKLDVIIDKQSEIYRELVRTNKKCDNLIQMTMNNSRNLRNIENNTSISAYNSERIAQEAEYQNFMLTYRLF